MKICNWLSCYVLGNTSLIAYVISDYMYAQYLLHNLWHNFLHIWLFWHHQNFKSASFGPVSQQMLGIICSTKTLINGQNAVALLWEQGLETVSNDLLITIQLWLIVNKKRCITFLIKYMKDSINLFNFLQVKFLIICWPMEKWKREKYG